MKTLPSRRTRGFTLVELLVVVLIISALAALTSGAVLNALQKAKKVTATASARAVESAVNNFFTEYGSMPDDGTATTDTPVASPIKTNSAAGVTLLKVLLGIDTTVNTRGVNFLNVQQGKQKGSAGVDGLVYETDGTTVRGLYDPWGGPFCILLDLDYNEKVDAKTTADTAAAKTLNGRRVAVWSDGADGVSGGGKATDDVKTW